MFASPAVAGDYLYIGSCSGLVYALNKYTGDTVWTYDTFGKSFHGDPIVTDSFLIIPTDDRWYEGSVGPMFSLNRYTGAVKWQTDFAGLSELGSGVTTSLALKNGIVVGVTSQDEVVALDENTGEIKWRSRSAYDTANNVWASVPAVTDSVVYFGGLDGVFYAYSLSDGKELWRYDIGARVTTSVALHHNNLFFGAADNHFYKLSTSGEELSGFDVEGLTAYIIEAYDDKILALVGSDDNYSGMYNLLALDTSLTKTHWSAPSAVDNPYSIKKPYLWRDMVLIGDGNGYIYLLDKDTGEELSAFQVDGEIRSLGIDGVVIYIGTIGGMVYAVKVS